MPEKKTPVQVFEVDYICDECGKGLMLPTNVSLSSMPPQFPHRCSECGAEKTFRFHYPTTRYEKKKSPVANLHAHFDRKTGSNIWPSSDPDDVPWDTFTCRHCGFKMEITMCGSRFDGEPSFEDQCRESLREHLMDCPAFISGLEAEVCAVCRKPGLRCDCKID